MVVTINRNGKTSQVLRTIGSPLQAGDLKAGQDYVIDITTSRILPPKTSRRRKPKKAPNHFWRGAKSQQNF